MHILKSFLKTVYFVLLVSCVYLFAGNVFALNNATFTVYPTTALVGEAVYVSFDFTNSDAVINPYGICGGGVYGMDFNIRGVPGEKNTFICVYDTAGTKTISIGAQAGSVPTGSATVSISAVPAPVSVPAITSYADTFNSSGTWIAPPGAYKAYIWAWGAGGSGAGQDYSYPGPGGGGGGGGFGAGEVTVSEGSSYDVVVGQGNQNSTYVSQNGFNYSPPRRGGRGGDSSFNSAIIARGGLGGANYSSTPDLDIGYGAGATAPIVYKGSNGSYFTYPSSGGAGGSGAYNGGSGGSMNHAGQAFGGGGGAHVLTPIAGVSAPVGVPDSLLESWIWKGGDGKVVISPVVDPFTYVLSNDGNKSLIAGAGTRETVTAILTSPVGGNVTLKLDSVKNASNVNFLNTQNGFTGTFAKSIVSPTEATYLNISSSVSTPPGVYTFVVKGDATHVPSMASVTTQFTVTVGLPDLLPLGAPGASAGPNAPVVTSGIISSPGKYTIGTAVGLRVQPQNIGAGFSSPDFYIKLQKKVAGANDSTYVDTGNTAVVSQGLANGMTVDRTINYTSVGTDKNSVTGMEFRYCVDSTSVIGEQNEANNCSGSVTLVFEQTAFSGTLSCAADSIASGYKINLTWTAVGGTNVSLFRGNATTPLQTFTGTSGTISDPSLTPNTHYTYYLRNGDVNTAPVMASATCQTTTTGTESLTMSVKETGSSNPGTIVPINVNYSATVDLSWYGSNFTPSVTCAPDAPWTAITTLPGTQPNVGPLSLPVNNYNVVCDGVKSNIVTVNVAPPTVACTGVVSGNGEVVTWTATPNPALKTGITYSYSWLGDESMSATGKTAVKSYLNSGVKSANVTMTATGNRVTSPTSCPSVNTKPNLIPLGAARDPISGGPNKPVIASSSLNPNGTTVRESTVVFLVQPKNVGAGFTGTTFTVKLQKKNAGDPITNYSNVAGATATVAGGLPFASTTNRYISYVSSSGDTNTTGYDFRYCVDLPPEPNGAVNEFYEDDNCSGLTKIVFEPNAIVVPAPASVSASALACTAGSGKINVSWTPVTSVTVDGYRVYRGTTSNFAANAGSYLGQVTSGLTYADTGLTIKQPYYYKVLAYIGASVSAESIPSPMSVPSETCPDLTAGNVRAYVNGNLATSTQIVEGDVVSFKADITNIGGDTALSFKNRFYVDKGLANERTLADQTLQGLLLGQSKEVQATIPLNTWTATLGVHHVIVCADRVPAPNGLVDEGGPSFESDASNCSNGGFDNFTVLPKITAALEGSRSNTNIWSGTSVIVNYEDYAKLRWNITGNPSTCTLNTNPVTNILPADYLYTTANNPKTVGPNLNGSKFVFTLTCSRNL